MIGFLFLAGIIVGLFSLGLLMIPYFVGRASKKLSADSWWNEDD